MKQATIEKKKGTLTVRLLCEIDHHTAKALREGIDERLAADMPSELILDFSDVGFMDSSGIALIIGRAGRAEELGATVRISGLSVSQRKLLRMSGVEKLANLKVE